MEPQDSPRFFQALDMMGEFFCDELSEVRQRIYWQLFGDVSITEWEYACITAMNRETFHKVPLAAVLWAYITEWRREQDRLVQEDITRQQQAAKLLAQAERLALEASPAWQAEQAKIREEGEHLRQEYETWLSTQSRSVLIALGKLNPPNPARWRPLGNDELAYEPTGDPEEARTRLRQQLRQLMDET